MRSLWIIVLAVMLFGISCGDSDTSENGETETSSNNSESYGEETIGYRNGTGEESEENVTENSGDPGSSTEDGDYAGDTGDTGDSGDSGNSGNTGDSGETSDSATVYDDEHEYPDDDPISSDDVKKEDSWTDWAGFYYKGNVFDAQETGIPHLIAADLTGGTIGIINADLSGNNFLEGTITSAAFFEETHISFVSSQINGNEYKNLVVRAEKNDFNLLLDNGNQETGLPAFLMNGIYKDDLIRKECVLAFTDNDTNYIGNAQAYDPFNSSVAVQDKISFNLNVKLTTDEETVLAAANEILRKEGEPEFTEPCICYDTDGTIMDCGALDEELGSNIVLLNEDAKVFENPFYTTSDNPAITFGLDVDTASYTLVRSSIKDGMLPDPESVRIEEMINYFKYYYKKPAPDKPFTLYSELGKCPWNPKRKLLMIGVRGQEIEMKDQPNANIVYLIDVSGSMSDDIRLMKKAFRLLANQMRPDDVVSIVTYAGADKVVLDGAKGSEKQKILDSIENLSSGGSTAGAAGITTAYEIAEKHFIEGGNNRVVLATDGDFNVGISSDEALVELIRQKKESGVFLSVYGFGRGNYQDVKMEELSNNGNGVYFYIDSEPEARRAFMHSLSGSMLTIAKDVKLQLQFNSKKVKGFRLIGYDNRVMSNDDFNDDTADGGELGNGQDMTAFVEIIPIDSDEDVPPVPEGQDIDEDNETQFVELEDDVFVAVRIRYKDPDEDTSKLIENNLTQKDIRNVPSIKFLFASAIAEFGLILRHSAYIEERSIKEIAEKAKAALKADPQGAIAEFIDMVVEAHDLGK